MSHPLERPLVRHGLGLGSAAVIAVAAVLFLEGSLRQVAFLIAAIDVLVTPRVLGWAFEHDR